MGTRNQSLDVLRGVAILLVMCDHYPVEPIMKAGWIGVDLFFVLSGFLISGLLFQEFKASGSVKIRRFLVRRGFKIWPAFYFFLAVAFMVTHIVAPRFPTRGFLVSATFLMSYFPGLGPIYIGPTWSLAVEEHFYVVLPFVLLALIALKKRSHDPFRAIPVCSGFLLLACLTCRCVTPASSVIVVNRASHLRCDALFLGVALGYVYHFRPLWFQRVTSTWSLLAALLLIAPVLALSEQSVFIRTIGLTCTGIGFALLVAWSVTRHPPALVSAVFGRIGFYSYSIYLWHRLISVVLVLLLPSWTGFAIYAVISIAIGIATANLIEIPALRLREKLVPGPTKARSDHTPLATITASSYPLPSEV